MLDVVLYEPEIAPNTGNIIRLCANSGYRLHLIEPLGFSLDEKKVRRAGLDYGELAQVQLHPSLDEYIECINPTRIFPCTTKGSRSHSNVSYAANDALLFGPETRGLPEEVRQRFPTDQWLRIPMLPESRSINLSNSVAIILYESWRQLGFAGAK